MSAATFVRAGGMGTVGRPLTEARPIERPSNLFTVAQRQIAPRATPEPTLRLAGETTLVRIGWVEEVLRPEHSIDITAIERLAFQDIKYFEASFTAKSGIKTELDSILVGVAFALRSVQPVRDFPPDAGEG